MVGLGERRRGEDEAETEAAGTRAEPAARRPGGEGMPPGLAGHLMTCSDTCTSRSTTRMAPLLAEPQ